MNTRSDQPATRSEIPVGDHRRLHDLLLELRRRSGEPSLRRINGTAGVSVGHLSQIFAGKTAPGPDVAVKIAQALRATDREQARVRFYAEGVEADRSAQRAGQPRGARRTGWEGCPYLGLAPFEEHHSRVFYGRRALTGQLLDRLRERPRDAGLLLVLGPSGAGKSSLLRAGLMGSLADDALEPGCRTWSRRVITPTGDPLRQLAAHLADLAGAEAISVHEALTARPGAARLLASQALATGAGDRLVLVVDQLEELFTLTAGPGEQQLFLTALHSIATGGALVVAGIRGDFLDQAMTFPEVRQAAEAGVFAVGPMSESELREAIAGPAAEAGVRVPDDVCAAILDDLRERSLPVGFDNGALPLLSQVMFVMWQTRTAAGLTVEGYHRTGGVADIVRTSAERVYASLDPGQRDLARRIFLNLTAVTDGRLTRRPGTRAALGTALGAAHGAADGRLVLEAFAGQRLLTVAGDDLVTIAHEELLRSWIRLHDWLRPSVTDQALHRTLIDDVQTWLQRHRDPSYLYQGDRLLAVDDAVGRWTNDPAGPMSIDATAREFLRAGHRRARRRRRAYRFVAGAMVVLLAVTGVTAVLAVRNAAQAGRQHALALSRQLAALSRGVADTDRTTSERLAAAALAVAGTDEALEAAGSLLADARGVLPGDNGIAAFSPDGTVLATASDRTVWLWDPATGHRIGAPLTGHTGAVRAVVFSYDGAVLAVATEDATVRLWNPATSRPIGDVLTGQSAPAFSPVSPLLATAGPKGAVRLWDPATASPVGAPLTGHTGPVPSLRFSLDGKLVAAAGDDHTVRVWNAATQRPVGRPMPGGPGTMFAMAFSSGHRILATAGGDATVRLRDPATGRRVGAALTGHTGPVYALTFTLDGKLLATAGEDHAIRLWDPFTGRPVGRPLTGHTGPVRSMRFSPDGKLLATASDDGTVRLWDPATGQAVGAPLTGHVKPVVAVRFSMPDGRFLASVGKDRTVRLWDPATGRPAGAPMSGHLGPVNAVVFGPDGRRMATASTDSTARLWGPGAGALLTGPAAPVRAVAFRPGGRLLATGGDDGAVWLWNSATGRRLGAPLTGHTGPVRGIAFDRDGKLLASGGDDGTVRLWDPATGRPAGPPITGHAGAVRAVTFSPDGTRLATAGADGTVRQWDPATGRPVAEPITGHTGAVYALAFSPDGQRLATAGADGTVRQWDPATGRPAGAAAGRHQGPVWAVRFSPDGRLLASGGDDATVRLWDPASGHPVGTPLTGHTAPVYGLAFAPDGTRLASASGDGTVRLWEVPAYRAPKAYLCDRTGGPTGAEWHRYAPDEPVADVCG